MFVVTSLSSRLLSKSSVIARSFSTTKLWSNQYQKNYGIKKNVDETPKIEGLGELNDVTVDRESYLFGDGKLFSEIGVDADLSRALSSIGKDRATAIQMSSFETIISGKDTIIAAETGSGKTLAYLIPVVHMMLAGALEMKNPQYPPCIIMVPNKELCSQVLRMANEVLSALKTHGRVVSIDIVSSYNGVWPYIRDEVVCPNIVICTPAYLANYIRGPNILNEDLFRSTRCLILDEADMILEGSYLKDIENIMTAYKVTRRQMIREGEVAVHTPVIQHILAAATLPSYGLRSTGAPTLFNCHFPHAVTTIPWLLSTEKYIEQRFPLAVKISNAHLHKHHPRIKQDFIELEEEAEDITSTNRIDVIVNAIEEVNAANDEARKGTMIFVNTADTAAKLASCLRRRGLLCAEFHKLMPFIDKEKDLELFRSGEVPVIVCTDHAARGLDLPGVYHVIQAEFALNVVNHLHRIGRASRAGNFGVATNLYGQKSKELVESILSDEDEGKIDQSFSRRRGFRQKIKKSVRRESERGVQDDSHI